MAPRKPVRSLSRRAAFIAAGAAGATALGALLTPAQASPYRPTIRKRPGGQQYRWGYRKRPGINDRPGW